MDILIEGRFRRMLIILPVLAIPMILPAQVIISDTLSGILQDTTYWVVDTVYVIPGDSLIVEPGTNFLMDSLVSFEIFGYFGCAGTEDDSIFFQPLDAENGWASIVFRNGGAVACEMSYCHITGAVKSAVNIYSGSDVNIEHSTITENSANWGGGIYVSFSSPVISDCVVSNNWSVNNGGGIYNTHSNTVIENCQIYGNLSDNGGGGSGQGGGGICANHLSNVTIRNCHIYNNDTFGKGGGIVCNDNSDAVIEKCVIYNNHTYQQAGGLFISYSFPEVTNCTLYGNEADMSAGSIGIYTESVPVIKNCIVANAVNGGGIEFHRSPQAIVEFCNIFANAGGNIVGDSIPQGLAQITTVNANGDSSDVYYNIFLDPLLVDPINGNFELTEQSPCIDAGDPASNPDPDSTVADIGALYFYQWTYLIIEDLVISVENDDVRLYWSAISPAEIYYIYRSQQPYFDVSGMNPIANVNDNEFIDYGAVSDGEWFYIVTWE